MSLDFLYPEQFLATVLHWVIQDGWERMVL
jgi:hypothetical protein